jgi:hypothetical protein
MESLSSFSAFPSGGGGISLPGVGGTLLVQSAQTGLSLLNQQIQLNSAQGLQAEAATAIVDQIETLMVRNRDIYLADDNRTITDRTQAIANFDALAIDLMRRCGQTALGDAGRRCVIERISGQPGAWGPGTRWDYPGYYLVPILEAPYDSAGVAGTIAGIDNAVGGTLSSVGRSLGVDTTLVVLGLALAGIWLWRRK